MSLLVSLMPLLLSLGLPSLSFNDKLTHYVPALPPRGFSDLLTPTSTPSIFFPCDPNMGLSVLIPQVLTPALALLPLWSLSVLLFSA